MNLPNDTTQRDLDSILEVLAEFEADAEKDGNPEAREAFKRAARLLIRAYKPQ
jgi:hypothetical protein